MAGSSATGATDVAAGRGRRDHRRDAARQDASRLDVPDWPGHRAGQHVDVRLTAEDGYQAERSYSIASPPDGTPRRAHGRAARRRRGVAVPRPTSSQTGDQIELRGPIGGYFVWEAVARRPAAARRRRLGRRAADGDDPPPRRAAAATRRCACSSRRAAGTTSSTATSSTLTDGGRRRAHPDALAAARLDGISRAASTTRCSPRSAPATDAAAARLRLRPDAVRRGRRGGTRAARPRAGAHQDRALRRDGRLRWTR